MPSTHAGDVVVLLHSWSPSLELVIVASFHDSKPKRFDIVPVVKRSREEQKLCIMEIVEVIIDVGMEIDYSGVPQAHCRLGAATKQQCSIMEARSDASDENHGALEGKIGNLIISAQAGVRSGIALWNWF